MNANADTFDSASRQEINDLYARYSLTFDNGDGTEFARLFTEDGQFVRSGVAPVQGSAALAEFARTAAARSPGTRHFVSNILIEPSDEGAVGTAYVLALRIGSTVLRLVSMGRYEDVFIRTAQGWRFSKREFSAFTPPELAGALLATTGTPTPTAP
jgi:limonene-1,2-epoxide hydrolase